MCCLIKIEVTLLITHRKVYRNVSSSHKTYGDLEMSVSCDSEQLCSMAFRQPSPQGAGHVTGAAWMSYSTTRGPCIIMKATVHILLLHTLWIKYYIFMFTYPKVAPYHPSSEEVSTPCSASGGFHEPWVLESHHVGDSIVFSGLATQQ